MNRVPSFLPSTPPHSLFYFSRYPFPTGKQQVVHLYASKVAMLWGDVNSAVAFLVHFIQWDALFLHELKKPQENLLLYTQEHLILADYHAEKLNIKKQHYNSRAVYNIKYCLSYQKKIPIQYALRSCGSHWNAKEDHIEDFKGREFPWKCSSYLCHRREQKKIHRKYLSS